MMSKYKYIHSKNNVRKELTRQQFIDALGEALPRQIDSIAGFGIAIADYDRGKKELNRMMYSLKKTGRNKSTTLVVVDEGSFWVEKVGD